MRNEIVESRILPVSLRRDDNELAKRKSLELKISILDRNSNLEEILETLHAIHPKAQILFDMGAKEVTITEKGLYSPHLKQGFEDKLLIDAIIKVLNRFLDLIYPLCCIYYKHRKMPDGNGEYKEPNVCPVCRREFKTYRKRIVEGDTFERR